MTEPMREQRVVGRRRLARQDVDRGTAQAAALERREQRSLVDDRSPPRVDQDRAVRQQRKRRGIDAAGRLGRRGRWIERMSLARSSSSRPHRRTPSAAAPPPRYGSCASTLRPERACAQRDLARDAPVAEQPERAARELPDRHQIVERPAAAAGHALGTRQAAPGRQDERERVLGDLRRAVAGDVRDDDPARACGRNVDAVGADGVDADDPATIERRDHAGVDALEPLGQQRVGLAELGEDRRERAVAPVDDRRAEPGEDLLLDVEPLGGDLDGREEHGRAPGHGASLRRVPAVDRQARARDRRRRVGREVADGRRDVLGRRQASLRDAGGDALAEGRRDRPARRATLPPSASPSVPERPRSRGCHRARARSPLRA